MATLSEQIAAHATTVFLDTDHFAEQVTHRPLGDDAGDVAVVANVVWKDPADNPDGGTGQKLEGTLDVAGSLTLDERDQWVIGGVLYQTRLVGEPQGGLRRVMIQRTKIQRRASARATL